MANEQWWVMRRPVRRTPARSGRPPGAGAATACPHPGLPPQAGEGAKERHGATFEPPGFSPSPACGGGPGWGPRRSRDTGSDRRRLPHPGLPPQAGEGAKERQGATFEPPGLAPSPACGGGPGWGPRRSRDTGSDRHRLPQSRPSPAGGGRSKRAARRDIRTARLCSLPRLRGRAGVGASQVAGNRLRSPRLPPSQPSPRKRGKEQNSGTARHSNRPVLLPLRLRAKAFFPEGVRCRAGHGRRQARPCLRSAAAIGRAPGTGSAQAATRPCPALR